MGQTRLRLRKILSKKLFPVLIFFPKRQFVPGDAILRRRNEGFVLYRERYGISPAGLLLVLGILLLL